MTPGTEGRDDSHDRWGEQWIIVDLFEGWPFRFRGTYALLCRHALSQLEYAWLYTYEQRYIWHNT